MLIRKATLCSFGSRLTPPLIKIAVKIVNRPLRSPHGTRLQGYERELLVHVHRLVPAESSATLSRPCDGACSRRTRSVRAGCDSTRPRGGRDRCRSAAASSTGGGCTGSAIVARDVLVTRPTPGLQALEHRSSP